MKRKIGFRGMLKGVLVLLSICLWVEGVFLPSQALAANDLFWTTGTKIGHANSDGSNINLSYIAQPGYGVVADSKHIYWTNYDANMIGRSDLDGGNVSYFIVTGCSNPRGIAIDSNYIYWINLGTSKIGRANLDGSNINPDFIALQPYGYSFYGLAVDANYIYWTNYDGHKIGRANLDGSNANQNLITGIGYPWGIAVDANYIYWANSNGTNIGRANLDGSNANPTFITGCGYPRGLAVDASYVYWANNNSKIGRANLNGSNANQSFISNIGYGYGVFASKINLSIQSFKADPIGGAPPLSVTFTCNALAKGGTVDWYFWDFDNDGVADEKTAENTTQHVYPSAGNYYAKVTVMDNLGDQLSSKAGLITVVHGPDLTGAFDELHWYKADNRLSFELEVKNMGDQDAGAFYTNFYLSANGLLTDSTGARIPFFKRVSIPSLAAGASTTITIDYTPADTSIYGKYIVVSIDPYNKVPDIYRINNTTQAAIMVSKPKVWP